LENEKKVKKIEINFGSSKIISTFATRFEKAVTKHKKFFEKTGKISTSKYRENSRKFNRER